MMKQFFLIVCCSLCFNACENEKQKNSIQGKLFNNCDYAPIGEVELILHENGNQDRSIAADVTTSNGSFLLSYEMDENKTGFADLAYFNGTFYEKLLSQIPLNESFQLSVFKNSVSTINVSISTSQTHTNDTLFYSVEGSNLLRKIVSPTNATKDTMIIDIPTSISNTENRIIYWGIGEIDFNHAKNALSDANSNYHQIPIQVNACASHSALLNID